VHSLIFHDSERIGTDRQRFMAELRVKSDAVSIDQESYPGLI